uniref:tricyclene synthase n=1 Tax=Scoparia dulcis TaxID=107240 RepID=A0A5K7XYE7_SCODU|nr:putative nerolidol synthase [Scoparia dulcis]
MASCNGLTNLIRPSFGNSRRTKFSRFRKNEFMCSAVDPRHVSQAAQTHEWRISHEHILSAHALSSTFTYQHYHHLNTCFTDELSMEHEQKIEDVRILLKSKEESEDPMESLVFVDAIQRLGVSSHFQKEIETILRKRYPPTCECINGYHTLYDVSLFFRLLRQHGHYISSDVFQNFRGRDGKFKLKLSQDMRGLMELYEAAQLSIDGEDILDEAIKFSSQHLLNKSSQLGVDSKWSRIVANKLRHPYHKSIARLTGKDIFIRDFKDLNEDDRTLRELLKLDLRMEQSVYQQELLQISRWWNRLGLAESLKIARNQPLKWYTWSMACLIDDISLSQQRIDLTKLIAFIYLIDDIFDVYGTLDELIIFTEAVNKWDCDAMEMLPDYMKICYMALLDTTNEIAHKIHEKHGHNPIGHLKTAWSSLCDAFLVEAKWFASGQLPSASEYLENGKVSSGVHVVLVHSFFLLDVGKARGNGSPLFHVNDVSRLISSVATILRLWDDLGSAEDEKQDGKDGSYLQCYMQDHMGMIGVEQAREKVEHLIATEWKNLNKACFGLNHNLGASSFKKACLNLARMVPLMYSYDDNQRLPILQEFVDFMLFSHASS